ncbi:hypothetical protein [Achromobacter aloeverae]|uniref:Type IVB pilus formation outer membrane protein, R64 PilN family n=1 Tax=Achromobacter aloeverae TaxID=1750518 RepID=A0A4Q1HQX2_9BURK|nr:hypothetical protein [Achromobacter aloeverae]RXN92983.1 hypothetical protein C7R54_04435 [Achromobacter aloeverae]
MLALAACVPETRIDAIGDQARQGQARAARDAGIGTAAMAGTAANSAALLDARRRQALQDVAKPWLAGRPRPLAREAKLPPALRRDVDTTLMFAGGAAELSVLAQRIAQATGLPVRVRPEALLPQALFLPRLSQAANAMTAELPARAEPPRGPQPLARTLDMLAWRLGVFWRYQDGAIEFFRTETRVFNIRVLTPTAQSEARLGRTGQGRGAGFDNASHTTLSVGEQDTLAALRARLEPFLTRAGVLAAVPGAAASIIVTDTPEALDRVARFLEGENRALTRRIRLVFEELTIVMRDRASAGIDWSAVFSSARAAVAAATPSAATAAGAVEAAVGGHLGLGIAGGPFATSKALIGALSVTGTVVRHSSVPVLTLNRRPVTHAVRTTFSYVDQVQGASGDIGRRGQDAMLPAVSVSQKQETVGSFLTLVPDAQDDGSIQLSIAYDNTVAQPLKTLTFGRREHQIELQQITIDGSGMVQQVSLRPGEPMVISGFDRRQDEYDRRRLAPRAPLLLGGADQVASGRSTTVVIVTAQVEEG